MDVFSLVARITLDPSAYNKSLGESEKNFQSFGSKLKQGVGTAAKVGAAAIAAVGTATVAVTKTMLDGAKETAEYGDKIDKMSQKIGISAEAYQEWDAILQHSGSSAESLQGAVRTLNKAFISSNDVIAETSKAEHELEKQLDNGTITFDEYNKRYDELYANAYDSIGALSKLGFSMAEMEEMSGNTDLALEKVIGKLQEMPDGVEKTAIAQELLGKSAMELGALLNTSAEDTEEMRQRVHELGGVMSDEAVKSAAAYQDSLQDMQTAMSGLKRNVMSEFLPSITKVMDGLSDLFTKGDTSKITEGINSFVDKIGEIVPKAAKKGGEIAIALAGAVAKSLPQAATSIVQALPELLSNLMAALPQVITGVEQIFYSLTSALPDLLKILLGALPSLIPQLVTAAVNTIVFLFEHIDEIIQPINDALPEIIQSIVMALISNLPELARGVLMLIDSLFKILIDSSFVVPFKIFEPILKAIGDFFVKAWEAIKNFFSEIWSAVTEFFGRIGRWVYDNIIEPVADYFLWLWKGIVSAFHTVIDPWIEIIKRASKIVYDKIVKPVLDYFKNLWEDIKKIWNAVSDWFNERVVEPVKNLFSGIWESVKEKAKEAWEGIKETFRPIADWFHEKFSEAWQKVKDVFSTGGKVFDGIKEGIVTSFKAVVNAIIGGINKVIVVPFKAINGMLEKLHDIEILGVSPFDWVHTFKIPEIPQLAKGGIVNRPVIAGEAGAEAIIPLENNTEWIQNVAKQIEATTNSKENNKLLNGILNEMNAMHQDMYQIILMALRTNSEGFNVSEKDMIRLVKRYAFA